MSQNSEPFNFSIDRRSLRIGITTAAITSAIFILIGSCFFLYYGNGKNFSPGTASTNDASGVVMTPPVTESNPVNSGAQLDVLSPSNDQVSQIAKKVFTHIFLPSGNVQVATVQNVDALRKQNPVFYKLAKNGDIVLIYQNQAILYDPVIDKVLDVIHFSP